MTRALLIAAGGGIGDVLLATPVARALAGRYDAVDGVTARAHRVVMERSGAFDAVFDDAPLRELVPLLAARHYDAAVVTWATSHTALLPLVARIPVRVGQARRIYSRAFTDRVTVRSERGDRLTHWTQILLDYARAIGCDVADPTPRFLVRDDDRAAARAIVAARAGGGVYAVLHPTRGIAGRRERWPIAGFVSLVRAIRERYGIESFISGSVEDAGIADAIASQSGAISVAGAASLATFAALAERASIVVAMDSGPMHLAAAVGAPTVGVFALASDEPDRWAPLGPRTTSVRNTYPCPPSHRKETCPDFACIRDLDTAQILEQIDRVRAVPAQSEQRS